VGGTRAPSCYYEPRALVRHLGALGLLPDARADEAIRLLGASARTATSVRGARPVARGPLVTALGPANLGFDELKAEVAQHHVRNTDQYRAVRARLKKSGGCRWPASPANCFRDFDERGGWKALLGLPDVVLPDDAMSLAEVVEMCGVSKSAIVRWPLRQIKCEYAPKGQSRVFFSRGDVEAYLKRRGQSTPADGHTGQR
jgi:hypothetical protein